MMKMMDWKGAYISLRKSKEWNELEKYLKNFDENKPISVEDIWKIMNQVWDDIGLDKKNYNLDQLNQYYSHPVWLLNNLFIETIKISIIHKS